MIVVFCRIWNRTFYTKVTFKVLTNFYPMFQINDSVIQQHLDECFLNKRTEHEASILHSLRTEHEAGILHSLRKVLADFAEFD